MNILLWIFAVMLFIKSQFKLGPAEIHGVKRAWNHLCVKIKIKREIIMIAWIRLFLNCRELAWNRAWNWPIRGEETGNWYSTGQISYKFDEQIDQKIYISRRLVRLCRNGNHKILSDERTSLDEKRLWKINVFVIQFREIN